MFNTLIDDPANELLRDRLSRLADIIRSLQLSTREEFLAEVYSRVNGVLALGNDMQPLIPVAPESPAVIGDLVDNLGRLNADGGDLASQLLRLEDLAATFYNLAATSQNSLRQQIREAAFAPDQRRYLEPFLHTRNLDSFTAAIDINAGAAFLPVVASKDLSPTIAIGVNSVGTEEVGVEALSDDQVETALIWNGATLELILSFPSPQIVNRLRIELDDYQGLEITSFKISPDGSYITDVLDELGVRSLLLNGTQGKFSGDVIIDFAPKFVQTMRLLIEDRIDVARIALRSLTPQQLQYGNSGQLTSAAIYSPDTSVVFTTLQTTDAPLTSITHQLSYDGANFSALTPGDTVTLASSPFWYRALLERASSVFDSQDNPVKPNSADPLQNADYTLDSSASVPLGGGLLERTLVFSVITGPVPLRDTPLPGTMQIQQGSVLLSVADYAFSGGILSFPAPTGSITLTYQTSQLAQASLSQLKDYYSPRLSEARFTRSL